MYLIYNYPYLYYIVGAAQLLCIYHCIKTGRKEWLYLLIFLPGIGAAIYFVREILPGLRAGDTGENVKAVLMPGARTKELERALRIADTDTNRLNLAAEYSRLGLYDKAIELVRSCLTGIYANSPDTLQILARLLFHNNEFAEATVTFEKVLTLKSNRFDKPDDELLYARSLDGNGNTERAEEEYEKIIKIHHSLEARYYYGLMLKRLGRTQEAASQFTSVQAEKDLHPPHVRKLNAQWLRLSARALKEL